MVPRHQHQGTPLRPIEHALPRAVKPLGLLATYAYAQASDATASRHAMYSLSPGGAQGAREHALRTSDVDMSVRDDNTFHPERVLR
jgi:hypothetical protein